MSNYWQKIKERSEKAGAHVSKAYQRLLDQRVCIGVTGFSRSGKTTLITSLLHQLKYHDNASLSAFSPAIQGRLLGAEWCQLDGKQPLFPYDAGIDRLSATPPLWPKPTADESSCLLEIRLKPKPSLVALSDKPYKRLLVEVRDYPGEWLVDIPMMTMSYQQWCQQWQNQLKCTLRNELLQPFVEKVAAINPFAFVSETQLNDVFADFYAVNQRCRDAGLTLLQPGQLLTRYNKNETMPVFFPLLLSEPPDVQKQAWPEKSWLSLLEGRYQRYIGDYVKPFVKRSLKDIDRQVLLIDVVTALSQREEILDDIQQALSQVLQTFSYGRSSWLERMLAPRIEKLAVVCTKVDQVLPGQHENIRQLTSSLVSSAYQKAAFCNVPVSCEAIASVRSSTIKLKQGDERLLGTTLAGTYGEMWHPVMPSQLPKVDDWERLSGWQPRPLLPPQGMKLSQGDVLPHIRLDVLIDSLIGDLCS